MYPSFSIALSAAKVVGSIRPAFSLNCRCVSPSFSHRIRRKVQCPNETECSFSRICRLRENPLNASFTRCAMRSWIMASRHRRKWVATPISDFSSKSSFTTFHPLLSEVASTDTLHHNTLTDLILSAELGTITCPHRARQPDARERIPSAPGRNEGSLCRPPWWRGPIHRCEGADDQASQSRKARR